jgi:hypothetical protein
MPDAGTAAMGGENGLKTSDVRPEMLFRDCSDFGVTADFLSTWRSMGAGRAGPWRTWELTHSVTH